MTSQVLDMTLCQRPGILKSVKTFINIRKNLSKHVIWWCCTCGDSETGENSCCGISLYSPCTGAHDFFI